MFGIEAWQKQFLNDLIRAIDGTEANQTVGSIIDSAEILHLAEIEEIFRLPGASIDFGEWGRGYDPNRPIKNYDLYSAIVQFISKKEAGTTLAERSASGGFEAPAEGVDPFLWTFLQGAWATNLSANFDAGDQALHVAEIPTAGRILGLSQILRCSPDVMNEERIWLSRSGGRDDSECPYREAEAPVEG